ncbi:MAG: hypothetical protein WAN06_20410 [Candidatus Sulfotelmatobacter sp.]
MSNATIQNREREGCAFVIYGLVCPITLEVRYVGQSTDLKQRTRDRTHSRHDEAVREWINSLGGHLRPYRVILERGVNRVVTVKVNAVRKPGAGRTPSGFTDVWLSSCLETKWIKRFRGTILNRRNHQIPAVYEALSNPPLPWDE